MICLHKKMVALSIVPLLLISCFEKDERVDPYPGDVAVIENSVNIYTSYFDLETGRVVSSHIADTWQLGFESSKEGWHIIVNSGSGWFLMNTHQHDIDRQDIAEGEWRYDIQGSYPDSTAAGNWTTLEDGVRSYSGEVFILGKIVSGVYSKQKKLQFLYVDSMKYQFFYADEENDVSDTITIMKIDSVNFVYFDFETPDQYNPEPEKHSYDLIFTSYYNLATQFGITIPYLVRGVLINMEGVTAAINSLNPYATIGYDNLKDYPLSHRRDAIGYRWKDVAVNPEEARAEYTIRRNYNYLIKTIEGNYYKMRFLSFNLNGVSGHPVFEYGKLVP